MKPMNQTRNPKFSSDSIRELRKALMATQEEFGVVVGVSARTVSLWETGKTRPSRLAVQRIQQILEEMKHEALELGN